MRQIGRITQLQVQTAPLKQGARPNQIYDPGSLRAVATLRLSEDGVVGLVDGEELLDLHHAHHPDSRQRAGKNGVSFNFTAHYTRMEARFGPHMAVGSAGENIVIACDQSVTLDELGAAIVIVNQAGDPVRLGQIMVAAPCEPFSGFALELDGVIEPAMIKETLQFLDGGMRGFYCRLDGQETLISVGDSVCLG